MSELILNNDGLHEVTYQDDKAIRDHILQFRNNSRNGMLTSGAGQMEYVGIPLSCIQEWLLKDGFDFSLNQGTPEWDRKLKQLVMRDCPYCYMGKL